MISCRWSLAVVFLAVVGSASATDHYVSNAGSDSAAGTLVAPWKTMLHAASTVVAGDTVYIRAGNYPEQVLFKNSGTSSARITYRNYPNEYPSMDQSGRSVPSSNGSVIAIRDRSYITIQGLTIQNWVTSSSNSLPVGIEVTGLCVGIQLRGNIIRHIWQSSTGNGDGHGIRVYGTNATAISDLVIDGNQIYDMRTGTSENLVLNGNVTGFKVVNNIVHDCNNIGIDMIGYEGTYSGTTTATAVDRARSGVVADNTVYNIDARYNPGYGGNFTTGGGDPSAGGIYVDGGSNIVIERNLVYSCNYGMELASEHQTGTTDVITMRDNIVHHCHLSGLSMGGYNSSKGTTKGCLVANNTLYLNNTIYPLDTNNNNSGQIFLQYYLTNCVFKNNIVWARSDTCEILLHYPGGGGTDTQKDIGTTNTFVNNLYYCGGGTPVFEAFHNSKHQVYSSLASWQASGVCAGDAGSTSANPLFEGGYPDLAAPGTAYQLSPGSPAINTGQASPAYQPGSGEMDFFKKTRVRATLVDRGADEH